MTVTEMRKALECIESAGGGGLPVVVYEGTPGTPLQAGIYDAGPRVIEPTVAIPLQGRVVLIDSEGDAGAG